MGVWVFSCVLVTQKPTTHHPCHLREVSGHALWILYLIMSCVILYLVCCFKLCLVLCVLCVGSEQTHTADVTLCDVSGGRRRGDKAVLPALPAHHSSSPWQLHVSSQVSGRNQ